MCEFSKKVVIGLLRQLRYDMVKFACTLSNNSVYIKCEILLDISLMNEAAPRQLSFSLLIATRFRHYLLQIY
jgi:hypothetical protein